MKIRFFRDGTEFTSCEAITTRIEFAKKVATRHAQGLFLEPVGDWELTHGHGVTGMGKYSRRFVGRRHPDDGTFHEFIDKQGRTYVLDDVNVVIE